MTVPRRRLHRTRLWLQGLFATIVILLAFVVGAMRLALPWIAGHPQHIANYLTERLKRPVTIGRIEAVWQNNGPLLSLHDVRLQPDKSGEQSLAIAQAELKINLFAWIHHNALSEFRLVGLDLDLARDAAGNWALSGLNTDGNSDSQENPLFDLGGLVLRDLHLRVDDAMSGRRLQITADEVRLLNDGSEHRVGARIRSTSGQSQPIDLVVDYDSDSHDAHAYVGGPNLDIAALLHNFPVAGTNVLGGAGRLQLWTTWRQDRLSDLRIEVDLNGIVLEAGQPIVVDQKNTVAPRSAFDRIAFGARWRRTDTGWNADIADLIVNRQGIPTAPARIHADFRDGDTDRSPGYIFSGDHIDISAPVAVAMLTDFLPPAFRSWLYAANPEGIVENAAFRMDSAHDYDVSGTLDDFSWHPVGSIPGIDGWSGTVLGDQDAITMTLPMHHAFGIQVPKVFRRQLQFTEFSGTLAAYRVDIEPQAAKSDASTMTVRPSWRVETDRLVFEGDRYGGELRGSAEIHDDGSRPTLDVAANVAHADVPASHLFWPINSMPKGTVLYLDRALDAGRVTEGRAVLRGDLADWPFKTFTGRFEATANIDDLRMKYLNDWPIAEHLHVAADFVNTSLHAEADGGSVLSNKINNATADIGDFGEPQLDVTLNAQGAGHDLLTFVRATPVGQRFGPQLLGVDVGGQGKVDLHLEVPLKQAELFKMTGTANLASSDLSDNKYGLHLDKANGRIRFGRDGFAAEDLSTQFDDQPARFSLLVGAYVSAPKHAVEANLQANAPVRTVLAYAPVLEPYAQYINGNAEWNAAFSADDSPVAAGSQRLTITSNLRGIAITLPEPLKKDADSDVPLRVTLGLPFIGGSLDLKLGDIVQLRGRLPTVLEPFAANVAFGSAGLPMLLPPHGFLIGGSAPHLDISGWLDFATSDRSSGGGDNGMLAGIELDAAAMTVSERDFGATHFGLKPSANGTDLTFKGANIDGNLHMPATDLRKVGITAQFAKLHWPELPEADTEADEARPSGENPTALPPLHIHIDDFKLGGTNFGEATVESYPTGDGTHFEQVSTHSDNIEMRARGDWTGSTGDDRSKFAIDFSAHNLGRMLDTFGNTGVVDGGATVAHIDGSWIGSPSSFALAHLDGTLKVSVKEGSIPDYNPGAGRLLGLFNLAAIPRRLAFDFGDLFKTGYSFDSIDGLFTLKDGNAFTSNLSIKSPIADMVITGRTGLKAKDWDQLVDVTPHVGSTLAIGGGLLGGPVGVAAGVLLQGVFRNQIADVTRAQYKITGTWKESTVTPVAKVRAKPKKSELRNSASPTTSPSPEPQRGR